MPRPERVFRSDAVILRRQDFGEADRLLTLLTPNHGKLRAIAKGARKPTARKTGHVELYTLVDMLIARGRELHIVQQAETKDPFLRLHEDLLRGSYASYVVELMDRFTAEQDPGRGEFRLLVQTLGWLCDEEDPRLVTRFYELRLLELAGFAPALHSCGIGQETLEPRDQFFSPADGGAVCPEHHAGFERGVPLSLNALKVMRHLQTQPWHVVRGLQVPGPLHHEIERLLLAYIAYLLEQRLQSVEFLRKLRLEEM
mgnify:FL=1|jgi:DNA repair protein RecO (recombination protein O)